MSGTRRSSIRHTGNQDITLGRIAGIRITVSLSWFVSIGIIVIIAAPVVRRLASVPSYAASIAIAVLLAVLLGVSVLAHELGHCLLARMFKIRVKIVRLYLVGGSSELERSPATPREEWLIAAAGPAVSALLAVAFWGGMSATTRGSVWWLIMIEMAFANGIVAVFNILPALPLDGGRVLRATVWRITGRRVGGTRAAVIGGFLVAAALLVGAAFALARPIQGNTLQAAILAVMGFFVAAGAWAEWPKPLRGVWPDQVPLAMVAQPAQSVPAEATGAQIAHLPPDRALLAVDAEGRTLGVVDRIGAAAAPLASVSTVLTRIEPEMIVHPTEAPAEVLDRIATLALPLIALVDGEGCIQQIAWTADIDRFLTTRRGQ